MNYDHAYHAGNFADVFKHIVLIALLQAMQKKPKPFCYLDTHAGQGGYDLTTSISQKTKEHLQGIEKIVQQTNPPQLVQTYLDVINHFNIDNEKQLNYYPGSPLLAKYFLRPDDRLIACELKKETYDQLKTRFKTDKQIAIHHINGWSALKAFLPPTEKRGLVLIDPPYEAKDEYSQILANLTIALKRFQQGVYAIWYPLKDINTVAQFHHQIASLMQSTLIIELNIYGNLPQHLNGCGVVLINPPYHFDKEMEIVLPWLWNSLTINNQGHYIIKTLK